ncbi:MAG: DUF4292 domain-containing protein [Flavobacteriaceae bacterium]|nr:DUF4292 domain-containing protein [Flavobacteriaceae bacterium]MBL4905030.1 DUF4292 domain-containing protein [Flavobacteriaceae bacterium]
MKYCSLFLVGLLLFASCKSSKSALGSVVVTKKMSAKKVSNKHLATLLDKQTIEAKLKVIYRDNRKKQKLTIKLRIEKDKVIWVNATVMGLLVSRAKITPDNVNFYEKINKTYFKGDFKTLEQFLGAEINFNQLQNLLLGQTIYDLKEQKYTSEISENSHLLSPIEQKTLFDIFFWINPSHFKLDRQEVLNKKENQRFQVFYKSYMLVDGETFPKKIEIRSKKGEKFTNISIEYRNVIFNKKLKIPFRVPRGYKRIALQ